MDSREKLLAEDATHGQHSFLFCDACGKIHEDLAEFVECDCGRVGVRMDWATPAQIVSTVEVGISC